MYVDPARGIFSAEQFEPELPPGHISIYAHSEGVTWSTRRDVVARRTELGLDGVNFTLQQFPLLPSFCVTGHKTQGLTLDRLIIGSHKSTTKRYLYVVLSRIKSLAGLTLLQPLPMPTGKLAAMYMPGDDVKKEMARLQVIEAVCEQNHDAFCRYLDGSMSMPISPSPIAQRTAPPVARMSQSNVAAPVASSPLHAVYRRVVQRTEATVTPALPVHISASPPPLECGIAPNKIGRIVIAIGILCVIMREMNGCECLMERYETLYLYR